MDDFVARHGLEDVTHIADTDGEVWGRFGIAGQPAWVFIDGETGERETILGGLGEDGLEAKVVDLTS